MIKYIFTLFAIGYMLLASSAIAQTATEGASPLRDSVKQKVAEQLAEIKKSQTKKAFLGTITTKAEASLALSTVFKETRTVLVSTDTLIKLKSGKDGTLGDLKVGDFVLVMGDADGQNTLTAKRLLIVPAPLEEKRISVFGTVSKKSASSVTLTNLAKEELTLKINSSTKYTESKKLSDIKEGQKITAISLSGTALFVHQYPNQ
jgi:hypothetical protein